MSEQDKDSAAVVQVLFDAFNAGDLDRAAALASDDLELVDVPSGQTFRGPEGLRQWLGGFRTAGPDARAEVTRTIVQGDWVATEHVGRLTHTGPLVSPTGAIPPTGRRVELHVAEVCRVKDGKIALLRAYYDLATMLRQLGLMPEPPAAA